MSTMTRLRSLALGAVAAAMLLTAPAAIGHEVGAGAPSPNPGGGDGGGNVTAHPPGFPVAKLCHRLATDPRLNATQHAAVVAACRQLKSDLQTAYGKLNAAVHAAQAEVIQARQAAFAACSNGQFDSQVCRDARSAFEQAKQQAMQEVSAARTQFQQDVKAAFAAFRSSLAPLKGTLEHGSGSVNS